MPKIAEQLKASGFEVVKVDLEKLFEPKGRGWRMAAIDLRAQNGQILEYQILPREMNEAGKIEHSAYKSVREKSVAELAPDEAIAKKQADLRAVVLYRNAFNQYLQRTGQTEATIKALISETRMILEGR